LEDGNPTSTLITAGPENGVRSHPSPPTPFSPTHAVA
jgi:hypothetical protein